MGFACPPHHQCLIASSWGPKEIFCRFQLLTFTKWFFWYFNIIMLFYRNIRQFSITSLLLLKYQRWHFLLLSTGMKEGEKKTFRHLGRERHLLIKLRGMKNQQKLFLLHFKQFYLSCALYAVNSFIQFPVFFLCTRCKNGYYKLSIQSNYKLTKCAFSMANAFCIILQQI